MTSAPAKTTTATDPAAARTARPDQRRRDGMLAAVVFLAVFLAFRGGGSQVYDARYTVLIAERLVSEGSFHLDAVPGATADPIDAQGAALLQHVNGHTHHFFPPGSPVLTAALMAVGRCFGASVFDASGLYNLGRETRLQRRFAPLLMATLAVVIFLSARLLLERRDSLVVTAAAAFGSQIWSTASRGLWSHTWGILLVGLAIYALLHSATRRRPLRSGWLATALCWAFFCRPTFAIPAAAVALYLWLRRRPDFGAYAAVCALWLAGFAAFCFFQYGSVLPPYYDSSSRLATGRLGEALLGNLVSPSRGILLYTPLLWVCGFLVVRFWRDIAQRDLLVLALSISGIHWITISTFPHWWGGWSYGSRLTTDLVPWFALLGILGMQGWRASRAPARPALRTIAWALLAASVLINANGGLWSVAVMWNRDPDIDQHPERLWDWSRPQFLHPFLAEHGSETPDAQP